MRPLISIIIPTYNNAKYIKQCLDSVVAQTYQNWEAIVVLSPSTDNTFGELLQFHDDRISVWHEGKKTNCATARNSGVLLSKGKYIAFLDADDWWYPYKLFLQISYLENHPAIGWVWAYASVHKGSTESVPKEQWENITPEGSVPFQTVVMRKSLVEKMAFENHGQLFDSSLPQIDDYDLYLRLKKFPSYCFRQPLSHYRYHRNGLTSSSSQTEIAKLQLGINIRRGDLAGTTRLLQIYAGCEVRNRLRPYKIKLDNWHLDHALQIEPTTRCNLNCPKCSRGIDTPIVDITPDILVEKLAQYRPHTVILQGLGEPFMHPYFSHICTVVKNRCSRLIVISNGTMIDPTKLQDIDDLIISMDSLGNTKREQMIEQVALMGHPRIVVNFVRTAGSLQRLKEVDEFCKWLGIPLHVTPIQNFYNPEQPEWKEAHDAVMADRHEAGENIHKYHPFKDKCPFLSGKKKYFDAKGFQHPCCIRMRYDQVEPTERMCLTCPT